MKKQAVLLVSIAAFALFIAGSLYAYNKLSSSRVPEVPLTIEESSGNVNSNSAEASEPSKIKAPDFTVTDSDGNDVKLSDMFGKPLVVNFWASWCPPCKAEMPEFNKVYEEMGEDVTFMMIDLVGGRETKENGEKYIAGQGFTFPVYYDTSQEAGTVYGISSIPTSLFIDADGNIVTAAQGQINEEMLRYGIDLIKGAAAE